MRPNSEIRGNILDSYWYWESANLPHGVKTLSLWKRVTNIIIRI